MQTSLFKILSIAYKKIARVDIVVVEKVSISILANGADAFLVGGSSRDTAVRGGDWEGRMREKERGREWRGWMDGGHLPHFTSPCWQTQAADLCFWGCLFTFFGFSLFTAAALFWYPEPALRVKHLAVKSQDWCFRISSKQQGNFIQEAFYVLFAIS